MKRRLLMILVVLAVAASGARADDTGEPDSLVIQFTYVPPNADSILAGHDSVIVQIHALTDSLVAGLSSGWKWLTPEMVMDSGKLTDEFYDAFDFLAVDYYKLSLDSSNAHRRWNCVGQRSDSLGGYHGGRHHCGTWWFHLTGVPDSVAIDTVKQPALTFAGTGLNEYAPRYNRPLVQKYNGTSVNQINDGLLPDRFGLAQNYPNPFNPSTIIRFDLPERAHVTLAVYNVLGQKVATLVDEDLSAGSYEREWLGIGDSGARVASGIYFYRLSDGEHIETKKMMMLK